jgi:hypothetical protein
MHARVGGESGTDAAVVALVEPVAPTLWRIVDELSTMPVCVTGRRCDILPGTRRARSQLGGKIAVVTALSSSKVSSRRQQRGQRHDRGWCVRRVDFVVVWRSAKALWTLLSTSFSARGPRASIGKGVRISASGSTTSSIVFEMSSASPVFMTSSKRLNIALLLVSCAVDM